MYIITLGTYEFILATKTWHEAEQDCITRGGHLASVNTLEEDQILREEILKRYMFCFKSLMSLLYKLRKESVFLRDIMDKSKRTL